VSGELAPAPGLERVAAIEAHNLRAWPATALETTADGWVFRATPGLSARGRSNHALTPPRPLERNEYDWGLKRAKAFADGHGIDCGVQVSPIDIHVPLLDELSGRGWNIQQAVVVMTGHTQEVGAGADPSFELSVADSATSEWIEAWAHCDRRADVEDHVQTVFPRMAGNARFVHAEGRASGISVELDGMVGLFCIAVSPDHRRQGLGKKLVQAMLAQHSAPLTYLQVFSENAGGVALYESLGFNEEYRYCHCVEPDRASAGRAVQPPRPAAAADQPLRATLRRAREHPCSRGDALAHKAAVSVDRTGVFDVDDHEQLVIKPEEANAIGPVFDLVWQRQPTVLHKRQEPALHKLLLIDWCHVGSMQPRGVTEPDVFVPTLQQGLADTKVERSDHCSGEANGARN
jgi:GNAT superfamily N-acetyltransferase